MATHEKLRAQDAKAARDDLAKQLTRRLGAARALAFANYAFATWDLLGPREAGAAHEELQKGVVRDLRKVTQMATKLSEILADGRVTLSVALRFVPQAPVFTDLDWTALETAAHELKSLAGLLLRIGKAAEEASEDQAPRRGAHRQQRRAIFAVMLVEHLLKADVAYSLSKTSTMCTAVQASIEAVGQGGDAKSILRPFEALWFGPGGRKSAPSLLK